MRKNFLLICSFISFACLHAQSVPQWVHNYRKVYPNSEYLVQRGKGDTAEKSVTDAMAALSDNGEFKFICNNDFRYG